MPTVVATVAVADLMAGVGDSTGGATSGKSAPLRRVNRNCSRPLGLANEGTTSIVGYGDFIVAFRSENLISLYVWHAKSTRMQATKMG